MWVEHTKAAGGRGSHGGGHSVGVKAQTGEREVGRCGSSEEGRSARSGQRAGGEGTSDATEDEEAEAVGAPPGRGVGHFMRNALPGPKSAADGGGASRCASEQERPPAVARVSEGSDIGARPQRRRKRGGVPPRRHKSTGRRYGEQRSESTRRSREGQRSEIKRMVKG